MHGVRVAFRGARPEREQAVACPECGAGNVLKQFSTFAVAGVSSQPKFGSSAGGGLLRRLLRLRIGVRAAGVDSPSMSELLTAYKDETLGCTRCPLASTRTQVVFGSGDANAELMFVGEAPGYHEDQQGVPFVGQAGQLLEKLLNGIGLTRADVYIANVLKCRPPGNRDPQPEEIEACESHLFRQIELIRPTLVATLGNFATKLLSGKPTGITRVHGVPQQVTLGGNDVTLYPLYHPAAALYTRSMLGVLEQDFQRIPELLGRAPDPGSETPFALDAEPEPEPVTERVARAGRPARALLALAWSCARPRPARPRRSPDGSRRALFRATSSPSRASSGPARRPSSAAPAERSASPPR